MLFHQFDGMDRLIFPATNTSLVTCVSAPDISSLRGDRSVLQDGQIGSISSHPSPIRNRNATERSERSERLSAKLRPLPLKAAIESKKSIEIL